MSDQTIPANHPEDNTPSKGINRRDVLKGLATLPVFGAIAWGEYRKYHTEHGIKEKLRNELKMSVGSVSFPPAPDRSKQIRLGVIGYGGRGSYLIRAAGFAHPDWIDEMAEANRNNPKDKRLEDFRNQESLNIVVKGVCDVFEVNAKNAIEACANIYKEGKGGKMGEAPVRYKTYKELCAAPDIDAVIIATPDHWHAPMAMEAARNGKHVYVEKPMTWTVPETYELTKIVRDSGITFQLGHQGRQTESYIKAREAIDKGLLGKISLIEVTTNRNDPNGAWVYDIHPEANPSTIDWQQFIGPAPWHEFSLERFFRWRCWWDYSTGLNGDLLTHEYDAINQILKLGIPHSASSSGGIYFYKDGRTVPDTLQVAYEFPKQDLTLLYSATLSSGHYRGKVIMGHDAMMELGDNLVVKAEGQSTRYRELIEKGVMKPNEPIYTYFPGLKNVDAVASPTEQYFAGRGLLYTYRNGRRVDTTFLHVMEWLDCIRAGTQPSCNIDQGFEEAITAHMATIALREGRTTYWDEEKQQIV